MNSIEVKLPKGKEGKVSCFKVGSMHNGEFLLEKEYEQSEVDLNDIHSAAELKGAAQSLLKYEKSGTVHEIDKTGTVRISDLEEGVYLLHGSESKDLEMIPTLVFVPTWMESEGVMLHDITVVPKIEKSIQTGDQIANGVVFSFSISFLAIFLILFCRKHLRKKKNCGTMQ